MPLIINEKEKSDSIAYKGNKDCTGFIKVWKSNPKTGSSELILEKKNTILYSGADLLAYALAGQSHAKISHFYVGYNNDVSFIGAEEGVDKSNSTFLVDSNYGYLRIPLTFPASFMLDENYEHNIVVFTIFLSNPAPFKQGSSPTFGLNSKMFEVGLVAALNTDSSSNDAMFSRAQFTPITFDPEHNLTISWGIRFTS